MSEGEKVFVPRMPGKERGREMIDVVDEDDRVIRQESRGPFYQRIQSGNERREGEFFRATAGLAVMPDGRILFFRRQPHHRRFPAALDYSVSGAVKAGELYEAAFLREMREELPGLQEEHPIERLGKLPPNIESGVRWHTEVYKIPITEVPAFNQKDFSEALLLSPEEFLALLEQEQAEHPERMQKGDFQRILETFFIKHD